MSTDKQTYMQTGSTEPESLLDELQNLLEKQMKLMQRGRISDVELLCRQAEPLVNDINRTGILEQADYTNKREQLQALYNKLCLALTAQKADISEKLSRIRKGKKTIWAYRNNVHGG